MADVMTSTFIKDLLSVDICPTDSAPPGADDLMKSVWNGLCRRSAVDIDSHSLYCCGQAVLNVVKATRRFETWLSRHTNLVEADLRLKHERMTEAVFPFMRATFYRWVQLWPEVCADLDRAPHVLAVGDLHVENFGTWRDIEGRLVWGVNDFDEASFFPYTIDLVRLAVSAQLAVEIGNLTLKPKDACGAIVDGYRESLSQGGHAYVLEEENQWLRKIALAELRDPTVFWKKMESLPMVREGIAISAREALEHLMPEPGLSYRIARRIAGLGSLGHERLVAIADLSGGKIAREAKALVPSAVQWVENDKRPKEIMYHAIISRAMRSRDPFVQLRGRWIVRRLSPHCCRVELATLPADRDELKLLFAMGWETANIHLGSRSSRDVRRHAARLKGGWLISASKKMLDAVNADWKDWRKQGPSRNQKSAGSERTR